MLEETLIDQLLREHRETPVVDRFSVWHAENQTRLDPEKQYRSVLGPKLLPQGSQYAFEVNLDSCSGCKSCVTACNSLNGLDEGETWREVGILVSESAGSTALQHVTTACHHCLVPACLEGCPVLAYEKDPATGIVKHLDDQCIGCQYCVLKCPYQVPKYSASRGIVRKCDMCSQRMAVGELPACAQACPNEAIQITVVDPSDVIERYSKPELDLETTDAIRGVSLPKLRNAFLDSSPNPKITLPTTRYVSSRSKASELQPVESWAGKPEPAHLPLVFMLVLSQIGIGLFLAAVGWGFESDSVADKLRVSGSVSLFAGMAMSALHLGRPLKAWKSFLGFRTSWLSREIIIFGVVLALVAAAVVHQKNLIASYSSSIDLVFLDISVVIIGAIGVFASGMIYHDTKRYSWSSWRTMGRFFGTAMLACLLGTWVYLPPGLMSTWMEIIAMVILALKLAIEELSWHLPLSRNLPTGSTTQSNSDEWSIRRGSQLRITALRGAFGMRRALAAGLFVCLFAGLLGREPMQEWFGVVQLLALLLFVSGELLERSLFFRASTAPKMPGGMNR